MMHVFADTFLCDFTQQKPRYYSSKNFNKNTIAEPSRSYTLKFISMSSLKVSTLCKKNYKIPFNGCQEKIIIRILEKKKGIQPPPRKLCTHKLYHFYF